MGRFDEITEVKKMNPYHDNLGRFSSGSGGGATTHTVRLGMGDDRKDYKTDARTSQFADARKEAALYNYDETRKDICGPIKDFYSKFQEGTANKDNYYLNTIAEFEEVKRPKRPPDYVSRTRDGKISSEYWYTDDGVIRGSNHWGAGVASCDWFVGEQGTNMKGKKQYGKAKWEDFTQKTEIRVNEAAGKAQITTFKNIKGTKIRDDGKEALDIEWEV
jgi:hypothetical protein